VLKQRIITAAVLIPVVVIAVLYLPTRWWALLCLLILLRAAWEWAALAGWASRTQRLAYTALVAVTASLLYAKWPSPAVIEAIVHLAVVWWFIAAAVVLRVQSGAPLWPRGRIPLSISGLLTLIPVWVTLVFLHAQEQGSTWLLGLLVLIWLADSGAYFAGRLFGRHRLANKVSPGKTWEGVAGAFVVTVAAAASIMLATDQPARLIVATVLLVVLTLVASIIGDLYESAVKRAAGVKDSSHLLPGHGGVLDRIDSLTAAAPVFVLGVNLLERGT
jgi:phosphatidate cytidylyltransferase